MNKVAENLITQYMLFLSHLKTNLVILKYIENNKLYEFNGELTCIKINKILDEVKKIRYDFQNAYCEFMICWNKIDNTDNIAKEKLNKFNIKIFDYSLEFIGEILILINKIITNVDSEIIKKTLSKLKDILKSFRSIINTDIDEIDEHIQILITNLDYKQNSQFISEKLNQLIIIYQKLYDKYKID